MMKSQLLKVKRHFSKDDNEFYCKIKHSFPEIKDDFFSFVFNKISKKSDLNVSNCVLLVISFPFARQNENLGSFTRCELDKIFSLRNKEKFEVETKFLHEVLFYELSNKAFENLNFLKQCYDLFHSLSHICVIERIMECTFLSNIDYDTFLNFENILVIKEFLDEACKCKDDIEFAEFYQNYLSVRSSLKEQVLKNLTDLN